MQGHLENLLCIRHCKFKVDQDTRSLGATRRGPLRTREQNGEMERTWALHGIAKPLSMPILQFALCLDLIIRLYLSRFLLLGAENILIDRSSFLEAFLLLTGVPGRVYHITSRSPLPLSETSYRKVQN